MNHLLRTLLVAAVCSTPSYGSAAEHVGTVQLRVDAPQRGRALDVTLWYPALPGGSEVRVGENPLFFGTKASVDAPVEAGRHPLVLLSHGSGGHAANLGWLASELALRGFLVAAPDHPGTTSGDSRPAETVKIWERPADLSAVLTGLETDPRWRTALDLTRVAAVGFSLGGESVLALAGARVDAEAYAAYCEVDRGPTSDCAWYARGGVDLRRLDAARFGGSFADPRLRSVVAVDPGLAQAFQPQSLRDIAIPVHFVNLGEAGKTWVGVEAAGLVPLVRGATLSRVADAVHFSFLGECRPNGAEILRDEGEVDLLCDDAGGRSRGAIHQDLARRIGDALAGDLD